MELSSYTAQTLPIDVQQNPWNEWLPSACKAHITQESQHLLKIYEGLVWSLRVGDYNRGASYWLRSLQSFLDLGHQLPDEALVHFAKLIWQLVLLQGLDATLQAKWAQLLARLLKYELIYLYILPAPPTFSD